MKAIILKKYGSIENFEKADLPLPAIQKGQIRIKIKAVSFNPVDYQIRKGSPGSRMVTSNILGKDLSGIVDEASGDVNDFKRGDEVYCYVCNLASSGTYAEYISVPSSLVAKKPISLSFEQAASIPAAGITAWLAIAKMNVNKSKSIFIAGGAGGVGTFAILFLKQSGIHNIVTTAGSDKSMNYLIKTLQLRKEQIINYRDDNFIEKAIERNCGRFDIALDLVGGEMLSACCELLAIDGNLVSVTGSPDKNGFETLFQKNASFHSVGANAYSLSDNREYWEAYHHILKHISDFFQNNTATKPPITVLGSLSVDTVRKAHESLENNSVQGKLIMTC